MCTHHTPAAMNLARTAPGYANHRMHRTISRAAHAGRVNAVNTGNTHTHNDTAGSARAKPTHMAHNKKYHESQDLESFINYAACVGRWMGAHQLIGHGTTWSLHGRRTSRTARWLPATTPSQGTPPTERWCLCDLWVSEGKAITSIQHRAATTSAPGHRKHSAHADAAREGTGQQGRSRARH
jgi:hypothetical protein